MALATVGLLGLMALQVTATRGNSSSRSFMEAVGIAQERIEMAQTELYATISTLAEGTTCPAPPVTTAIVGGTPVDILGNNTVVAPNQSFTRCTAVTVGTATTNVQVTVQWTEFNTVGSVVHNVTMMTTRSP